MAHIQRRCPQCSTTVPKGHRSCAQCGTTTFSYRVRYIDDQGAERSKSFPRRTDADTFLTSVSHNLLAGTYIDPMAGRAALKTYAEQWRLNQAHLRPRSAQNLEQSFRLHVYPILGDRPLSSFRPSDIASWQRGRLKPVGPLSTTYVWQIRGKLSEVFEAAVGDRLIASNPVKLVKAPSRDDDTEVIIPTVAQVDILESKMVERWRPVIPTVAGSGLRFGEVFGLTVDRVDFLRKNIKVDRQLRGRNRDGSPIFGPPKTAKSNRTIPIADVTVKALAAHLAVNPVGPYGLIFATKDGGAVSASVWGKSWRIAARAAGLELGEGLHQLRHFYASLLIQGGRSVVEVQKRLGHKSAEETLKTYAHLWPENEDGTRAAIEAVLARPSQAVSDETRPFPAASEY